MTITMYTDTFLASEKSLLVNPCGQIFATPFGYLSSVLPRKKGYVHLTLSEIFQEVAVTTFIRSYNARELNLGFCK